jgi:SAM-dependent methyltransferase
MNNKIYSYKGKKYPTFIKNGNAAKFVIPFAQEFCFGDGLDIGGFFDWTFPGSKQINITINDEWDALKLPKKEYDYIFSSHTLEHLPNYVEALKLWKSRLKPNGVLYLYLPHPDMEYWLPQNNDKHLHEFYPKQIAKVLNDLGFKDILHSERDMYWSFTVVAYV